MFLAGVLSDLSAEGSPARPVAVSPSTLPLGAVPGLADPRARLADLPLGAEAQATMQYMRQFVDQAIADPAQLVRNTALALYADLPPRNYTAEADAVQRFVRDHIRYVRDPTDRELVQSPQRTLELRAGDCDDKATLTAAMLKATGHPVRFLAVGIQGGDLSHVLAETKIGNRWIPVETIIPRAPLGWYPPGITKRYIVNV